MKNCLDSVVKPDKLTHSVTTMISKQCQELLHMSTEQNLDWNGVDRQTEENKTIKMFGCKKGLIYTKQQSPY